MIAAIIRDKVHRLYARDLMIQRLERGDSVASAALQKYCEPGVVQAIKRALNNPNDASPPATAPLFEFRPDHGEPSL